jgi:hypothetical protein
LVDRSNRVNRRVASLVTLVTASLVTLVAFKLLNLLLEAFLVVTFLIVFGTAASAVSFAANIIGSFRVWLARLRGRPTALAVFGS